MTFELLTAASEKWDALIRYAEACSWSAGKALAQAMRKKAFSDWERILVALDGEKIRGYCTIAKTDCIPDVSYTPYIGFLFVDEACRGHRLSQQMILCAMDYLKSLGFPAVYLVSDHENLYEKYGFRVIDRKKAFWGPEEKIYIHAL
ncbi:MAG: GNAT family N-acetyltransferase [Clostridia bacterium]|nr:GNAT family N-acetyltransferase [Clostridia bacterium]MBQ6961489.1 GNAT family N-acetyltransferase [Clostridia bacterium]